MYKKGIQGRNKKGQFISRKSTMFAIANSVYHTGLKTTDFFQNAFYDSIDTAIVKMETSMVDKLENAIVDSISNNKKLNIT